MKNKQEAVVFSKMETTNNLFEAEAILKIVNTTNFLEFDMRNKKEKETDFFLMLGDVIKNGRKEVKRLLKEIDNKQTATLKTIEEIHPHERNKLSSKTEQLKKKKVNKPQELKLWN